MRKLSTIFLFVIVATTAFASSPVTPSFRNLWETADVVISSVSIEIEPHSYQGELPSDWELDYQRVQIHFIVREVLKGKLEDGDDQIWVEFYTATVKDNPINKNNEVRIWGSDPYLKPINEGVGEEYLVFLRRDVFGRLEPVHKRYFLSTISPGYKIQF